MHSSRESLTGILCVVGLVAAAYWYAKNATLPHGAAVSFNAATESASRPARNHVRTIDWSADGRTLLASTRDWNGNQSVVLYTLLPSGDAIPIELTRQLTGVAALAPDALHVLIGTNFGELCWFDVATLETTSLVWPPQMTLFSSATVAADGQAVAAATTTGHIFLCDLRRGTVVEINANQGTTRDYNIADVRYSHDGRLLASSHTDGSIGIWDTVSGERRLSLKGDHKPVTGAAFLPDAGRLISVGHDDRMRIWDIGSGAEEWQGTCGLHGVNALTVSPDGTRAACGGRRDRIVIWDLQRRQQKLEFMTTAQVVRDLQFSFDGSRLAVAGMEGTIRFYDAQSGVEQMAVDVLVGRR